MFQWIFFSPSQKPLYGLWTFVPTFSLLMTSEERNFKNLNQLVSFQGEKNILQWVGVHMSYVESLPNVCKFFLIISSSKEKILILSVKSKYQTTTNYVGANAMALLNNKKNYFIDNISFIEISFELYNPLILSVSAWIYWRPITFQIFLLIVSSLKYFIFTDRWFEIKLFEDHFSFSVSIFVCSKVWSPSNRKSFPLFFACSL